MSLPFRVLHVAAELYPLVKTGGLADVAAALPQALAHRGQDVRILLPGLPDILAGIEALKTCVSFGPAFGAGQVHLKLGRMPGSAMPVYVIDAPFLYARPGNPYQDAKGVAWSDNHLRFGMLGWVGAQLAAGALDARWAPDVLHCHDWHAGLGPAYLAARPGPRPLTVFTVHNLAYQGLFESALFPVLGLPPQFFRVDGVEFHGQLSFMKAGLQFADRITTVSPTYAREISSAEFACGLEGLTTGRAAHLSGILNGVDYAVWDPMSDADLPAHYSLAAPSGKAVCKAALQAEMGLAQRPNAPLFGIVSRLTEQKGLDLVLGGLSQLTRMGAQVVVLGSGDSRLEMAFAAAAAAEPDAVSVRLGFDEALSHRIMAGADMILVPSRFEPCGLTQLYGLRYGALPLVRRTGGLADTVVDANALNMAAGTATGFVFDATSVAAFVETARRACVVYGDSETWQKLMKNAMSKNFSWDAAAASYAQLYREALDARSDRAA